VQVGVREGDMVQVLYQLQPDATVEGVQPGERVVTVGGLGLEDEVKVKIVQPGEAGAAADEKKPAADTKATEEKKK
jgi:hypothetical protein